MRLGVCFVAGKVNSFEPFLLLFSDELETLFELDVVCFVDDKVNLSESFLILFSDELEALFELNVACFSCSRNVSFAGEHWTCRLLPLTLQ